MITWIELADGVKMLLVASGIAFFAHIWIDKVTAWLDERR